VEGGAGDRERGVEVDRPALPGVPPDAPEPAAVSRIVLACIRVPGWQPTQVPEKIRVAFEKAPRRLRACETIPSLLRRTLATCAGRARPPGGPSNVAASPHRSDLVARCSTWLPATLPLLAPRAPARQRHRAPRDGRDCLTGSERPVGRARQKFTCTRSGGPPPRRGCGARPPPCRHPTTKATEPAGSDPPNRSSGRPPARSRAPRPGVALPGRAEHHPDAVLLPVEVLVPVGEVGAPALPVEQGHPAVVVAAVRSGAAPGSGWRDARPGREQEHVAPARRLHRKALSEGRVISSARPGAAASTVASATRPPRLTRSSTCPAGSGAVASAKNPPRRPSGLHHLSGSPCAPASSAGSWSATPRKRASRPRQP